LLTVKQFVNDPYTSNTFILEEDNSADVYLIDAGFTCSIKELLGSDKKNKRSVLNACSLRPYTWDK
jgi:hypothetical protein